MEGNRCVRNASCAVEAHGYPGELWILRLITRTSRMSAAPSFSSSTITPGRARDPLVVVGGSRWLLSSTKPKGT